MFGVLGNMRDDFPAISDSRTRSSPAKPRELAPRPWPGKALGAKASNAKGIEPETPFRTRARQKRATRVGDMQKAAGDIACTASRHRGCEPGGPEREKAADRPAWARRRPLFFAKTRETLTPRTKKGDPLGSPSPRCLFRASPPLARATRPGGRRRPSLPQGRPCSTIGAGRLNFRVRYGSGCAPAAVAAGPRGALRRGLRRGGSAPKAPWGPHSARGSDCLENGRERRGP